MTNSATNFTLHPEPDAATLNALLEVSTLIATQPRIELDVIPTSIENIRENLLSTASASIRTLTAYDRHLKRSAA